jgi:hypothetical protein
MELSQKKIRRKGRIMKNSQIYRVIQDLYQLKDMMGELGIKNYNEIDIEIAKLKTLITEEPV